MQPVLLLMGATATGKTDMAMRLADRFPCDLISVDSAMVYRGMDIGTAKPDAATLAHYPHQLVDIRDPEDAYSVGDFLRDANAQIAQSHSQSRVPILVGGTMMYFRAFLEGIAELPQADTKVRQQIDEEAEKSGWPSLHQALAAVDPEAAARLKPNDKQRIQRALEVFRISGVSMTEWHRRSKKTASAAHVNTLSIALDIEPRALLHKRILERLDAMIAAGFVDEVEHLKARDDLHADTASMRAVGYRQFWQFLDGAISADEARDQTLFATRQLAKRQLTWLRSMPNVTAVDALEAESFDTISQRLRQSLG